MSFILALVLAQTHCSSGERVVMSCQVKKKVLSVCTGPKEGTPTWLQYRFGPLGKPELIAPTTKAGSLRFFRLDQRTLATGTSTALIFANDTTTYEVFTQDGKDASGGVVVRTVNAATTAVGCTNAFTEQWDDVKFVLAAGDVETFHCAQAGSAYADRAFTDAKGHMDGVQQAELAEAVTTLCSSGWSLDAARCVAKGAPDCPLTPAQRKALETKHREIFTP